MGLFRRERRGYIDEKQISRKEVCFGAAFIFAAAIIVVKVAALQFDRVFIIATGVGLVLLLLTRYKLAYVAAAVLWMASRFAFAFAMSGRPLALGLAAGLGAAGWGLFVLAARREL